MFFTHMGEGLLSPENFFMIHNSKSTLEVEVLYLYFIYILRKGINGDSS